MNLPILVHVPAVIMLTFTLLLLCSAVSKKPISFTAIHFRGGILAFFKFILVPPICMRRRIIVPGSQLAGPNPVYFCFQ